MKNKGFVYAAYALIAIALADLFFGQSDTPVPIFGNFLTQQIDGFLIVGALLLLLL